MKKALSSMPFNKIAFFVIGILTLSLSGCLDNDNEAPEPQPRAFVSFYHGSPDAPDLDVLVNSQKIFTEPLQYSDYTNYVAINPGNFRIAFTPVNSIVPKIDTALTFQEDKIYSVFAINSLQQIEVLVLQDSLVSPAAGKSRVRFIHLSPDAPAVDMATTGTTGTPLFTNVAFKGVTEFQDINAGSLSLQVTAAGTSNVLKSVSNVNLVSGRIYTFVFRGLVTPPAGNTTQALDLQLLSAGN